MELPRRLSQVAMLSSRLIRLSSAQNVRKLNLTASRLDSFNVQDKEDFEKRVLKSQTPVLVDFHAKWCGPCKILGPRLESVIAEHKDKIHLAKVDIDDVPELAEEYDVSAVPSVLGLKNGQVQDMFVGVLDEDKLKSFVKKIMS